MTDKSKAEESGVDQEGSTARTTDAESESYCDKCDRGTIWDWDNCPLNCPCTYDENYRIEQGLMPFVPLWTEEGL